MAKQTFTTGSVLTSAQMTSLQQTAMLGGAASAKTASYTLVAADAGTVITMSNASATTITVNTGLFAAGDTVTILNIGAGTCTITAGTATVAKPTNATLALVTNAGGVLYFTATSASTFMPFDVGSTNPLTTKGDLFGFDTAATRIPIGTNNYVLTADSTQALGLKWASAPSPSYTWTSYTPTWKQLATTISTSSDNSRYLIIGKTIFVLLQAIFSSAGSANGQFRATLPASYPASSTGYGLYNAGTATGVATLYDASATSYTYGIAVIAGGTEVNFGSGSQKSSTSQFWGYTGSDWPQTIASGDTCTAFITYAID